MEELAPRIVEMSATNEVEIPQDVRVALRLAAGDRVLFSVRNGQMTITKLDRDDELVMSDAQWAEHLRIAMPEWFDEVDAEAYRDL